MQNVKAVGKNLKRRTVGKVQRDLSKLHRDENGNLPVTDTLFVLILSGSILFFYGCLRLVVYLIQNGYLPKASI